MDFSGVPSAAELSGFGSAELFLSIVLLVSVIVVVLGLDKRLAGLAAVLGAVGIMLTGG